MYSGLSPIPSLRKHHAADDGGELIKKVGTSAKETRSRKLDTVWQIPAKKKQARYDHYASEMSTPDLGLGVNNK